MPTKYTPALAIINGQQAIFGVAFQSFAVAVRVDHSRELSSLIPSMANTVNRATQMSFSYGHSVFAFNEDRFGHNSYFNLL